MRERGGRKEWRLPPASSTRRDDKQPWIGPLDCSLIVLEVLRSLRLAQWIEERPKNHCP